MWVTPPPFRSGFARPAFRLVDGAGGAYQFRTLCFGLRSAPRVFTRLLRPIVALLRQRSMRLIIFLDDIAVLAQSPLQAVQ
eukprot:COSAG01_NODE_71374_length_256_cov_0.649682_1_plen_80_part_01